MLSSKCKIGHCVELLGLERTYLGEGNWGCPARKQPSGTVTGPMLTPRTQKVKSYH